MRLVEISAWNDSGGGFLNRLLDGHPELQSWPYELLLGTEDRDADEFGDDWFRRRFRWPRLGDLSRQDGATLFDRIPDTELKAVLRDPAGAKHRDYVVEVDMGEWQKAVSDGWKKTAPKTQAAFLKLYISEFFRLWRGRPVAEGGRVLAHCPVAILDAPEIWSDFPDAQIVHVVRDPCAGYADMRRRHPDLAAETYAAKWQVVNGFAATLARKYPQKVRIVHLSDLLSNRTATLKALCEWMGIGFSDEILEPTWNGCHLEANAMGPFGGVPHVAADREQELAEDSEPSDRESLERLCAGVWANLHWTGKHA